MMERGAFPLREASVYLGHEPESRWLLAAECPIPRVDARKRGAGRPLWRWRRVDLDAFLAERLVRPGEVNPQERQ